MIDFLQAIDNDIMLALNQWHTPYWDKFMSAFSGKIIWAPMYATIIYILFRNLNWKSALCFSLAIILAIAAADMTCARLIRPFAERLRPSNLENPISSMVHIVDGYRGGAYGFPSCHAANSFALASFIALLFRNRALGWFIFIWATLNSYTRLYLGVHYPGDLLVGAIIGSTIGIIVYKVSSTLVERHKLTLEYNQAPNSGYHHTAILPITGIAIILAILVFAAF